MKVRLRLFALPALPLTLGVALWALHSTAGEPRFGPLADLLWMSAEAERDYSIEEQLELAMQHQVATGGRLGQALIELGHCTDADIARALADQLEIPYVDLQNTPPSPECVSLLPPEIGLEFGLLPIRLQGNRLVVAVLDTRCLKLTWYRSRPRTAGTV